MGVRNKKTRRGERNKGGAFQIPQRTFIGVKIWRHGHIQPKGFLKKLKGLYNHNMNDEAEGRMRK